MADTTDLQHAEQGKTLRVNYVALSGGVPFNPTVQSVRIHPGQITTLGTEIATLSPVYTGQTGKYYADWVIPLVTPVGFYTFFVDADIGTYTFSLPFELFVAGAFTPSPTQLVANTITTINRISAARNEDVFVALVRMILRDHPVLNRLTKGRETDDGTIRAAMVMAISTYNGIPPLLQSTSFTTFPSVSWLVMGTIAWVLQSSMFLRLRNNLPYTDGGVTVDTENLAAYQAVAANMKEQFMEWAKVYKPAKNLNDAFGYASSVGLSSEYGMLAAYIGDYTLGGSGVPVT